VFGVTLEESLEVAQIAGLPAIVFRCIQYLEKMQAEQEEGIYRLSGSSAVIKNLKDKFNTGTLYFLVTPKNIDRPCEKRGTWTYFARTNTGIPTP
jgi:hypothetical protein